MVKQKFIFYIMAVILILFLLSSISGILLPFVLAGVLAYLLDPLVDRLEEKKINRAVVSASIVSFLFLIIFLILGLVVPLAIDGFKEINYIFDNYELIFQQKIIPFIQPILPADFDFNSLREALQAHSQEITQYLTKWVKALALSTMKVFDLVSIFLITPLALYYLLKDWDKILDALHTLVPETDQGYVGKVLSKIDMKLSSFVRGQLLVCLALGAIYGIGLSLVGLKLGLVIGFLTGLLSFIPFVGMLLGGVTALVIAFLQFPLTDIQPFILVLAVFGFGQIIESAVLSPKLVGDALGLHPLWIIFVVLAGGELGGFLGVLIALPVAAIISVIVKEGLDYYKKTSIYSEHKIKNIKNKAAKNKAVKKETK